MAGGNWTPGVDPGRPGLFLNFAAAASDAIKPGNMGVVAMPYSGTIGGGSAVSGGVYSIASRDQAIALFGVDNIKPILRALAGGAREVLVYVMANGTLNTVAAYTPVFTALDARDFDVFTFDTRVIEDVQDAAFVWMKNSRADGRYFHTVFGAANAGDDADVSIGVTRSTRLKDDFAVNLITGYVDGVTVLTSSNATPYVAGMLAGCALNASLTYAALPFTDVNVRLTGTQIKTALAGGCLVLVYDGDKVKVERGIATSKVKLRRTRTQKAVATDVAKTAADSYIGKVINNEDGQTALVSAIKAYLEKLAADGVIDGKSIKVKLSDTYPSTGDQVYVDIAFTDLDSVEEIYLTVTVG